MCGFFVVKPKNKKFLVNKKKFIHCTKMMKHRGPDDLNFYFDKNICMGFNRLSIIDLSSNGAQPFQSEDSQQVLVYNGYLSNSDKLKNKLRQSDKNINFKGHSDTEVLYRLIDSYDSKIFSFIKGMYSFVSYHKKKNSLLVARDPFGIKPLYFFENKDYFVFSSEIKPIIKFTKSNKISDRAITNYFFLGTQDNSDQTFFSNIKSIKSGFYLRVKSNKISNYESFFNLYIQSNNNNEFNIKKIKTIFEKKFSEITSEYLNTDRKCASFLSSGVDSSYISKSMSLLLNYKVDTFTYGFSNYSSENLSANKFAKNNNMNFNNIYLNSNDVINRIDNVIKKTESPITSIRLIAVDKLYQLVNKKGYNVILEGTGGDEALGGYEYNYIQFLKDQYPSKLKNISNEIIKKALDSNNFYKKIADALIVINNQNAATTDGTPYVYSDLFNFDYLNENLDQSFFFKDRERYYQKLNNLQKSQFKDIYEIKLPKILNYSDKIAMSYSVETRFPFLDEEIFKFCFNLKNIFKRNKDLNRYITSAFLKNKTFKDKNSLKKKSIVDPQTGWLSNELYEFVYDNLNSVSFSNLPYFNKKKIIEVISKSKKNKLDTSYNIFQILSFFIFYKNFKNY